MATNPDFAEGITERTAVECAAAYVETAFAALDEGDVGLARASLRRTAQYLLVVDRWDAVNGTDPPEPFR